jgi:hypothetical protein
VASGGSETPEGSAHGVGEPSEDGETAETALNAVILHSTASGANCSLDVGHAIDLNAISFLACFLNKNDGLRGNGTSATIGGGGGIVQMSVIPFRGEATLQLRQSALSVH